MFSGDPVEGRLAPSPSGLTASRQQTLGPLKEPGWKANKFWKQTVGAGGRKGISRNMPGLLRL